ncbi:hypothetical protein ACFE04_009106 [Oxalis oulophora]
MNNTPLRGIHEHQQKQEEEEEESSSGCVFFNFCWPKNRQYIQLTGQRYYHHKSSSSSSSLSSSWFFAKFKRVKEVTESITGPKLKTFIRKMSGCMKKNKRKSNNNSNNMHYHYDAYNYALNFDSGDDEDDESYYNVGVSRFPATPLLGDRRKGYGSKRLEF